MDAREAEGEHHQEHGEDEGAAHGPGSTLLPRSRHHIAGSLPLSLSLSRLWRSGRFIKAGGGGRRSPVPGGCDLPRVAVPQPLLAWLKLCVTP
jgi:hypothetical protein